MIVLHNNERLYLRPWEYNSCCILSKLAEMVENDGGKVKPTKKAIISRQGLQQSIIDIEYKISMLDEIVKNDRLTDERAAAINKFVDELDRLKNIDDTPITVTHTTYISFVLDGYYYYFQTDSNPFFEFYYIKTPIKGGKYSKDASLEQDQKEWLYDDLFCVDCPKTVINECAEMIYQNLVSARPTQIMRDKKRIRVNNTYDNGYHYETVYEKERIEKIDW